MRIYLTFHILLLELVELDTRFINKLIKINRLRGLLKDSKKAKKITKFKAKDKEGRLNKI